MQQYHDVDKPIRIWVTLKSIWHQLRLVCKTQRGEIYYYSVVSLHTIISTFTDRKRTNFEFRKSAITFQGHLISPPPKKERVS